MCPSYRATLDERDTTRGRANALRLAISGQLPAGAGGAAWGDRETLETLSLCLSCKACKTECPSNVDMARLKAEYLAQTYRAAGRAPLAARVFGHVRTLNRLGAMAPGLARVGMGLMRPVMNRVLGLAPQRTLPGFGRSLYRWFEKRAVGAGERTVVLFGDCFTAYNEPGVGRAAVGVLEKLGYRVVMPRVGCCGRSMISTGLLGDAIAAADGVLRALEGFVEDPGVAAIVVCEPSCLSAMKDDYLT
jgi:Fe-S oxidoreductase